jgi:hypothetical protein
MAGPAISMMATVTETMRMTSSRASYGAAFHPAGFAKCLMSLNAASGSARQHAWFGCLDAYVEVADWRAQFGPVLGTYSEVNSTRKKAGLIIPLNG